MFDIYKEREREELINRDTKNTQKKKRRKLITDEDTEGEKK